MIGELPLAIESVGSCEVGEAEKSDDEGEYSFLGIRYHYLYIVGKLKNISWEEIIIRTES